MTAYKNPSSVARAEFGEELSIVSRKLRTLFDARVRERGLTLARARALIRLAKKDCMTQTDLAEALEIEGATLVRLLDGLEKQALIERKPVEGDRRANHIALTDGGREQAREASALVDAIREEIFTDVSEVDLMTTIRVLRAIAQNIEAAS